MRVSIASGPLLVLGAVVVASSAAAQQGKKQEFRIQEPGWVSAGQTATVKLYGQDLNPNQMQFQAPGIVAKVVKVEEFAGKTDAQRKWGNRVAEVELTVAAGSRPGSYPFTLSGEGVQPEMGRLCVDVAAPEIPEAEPNNELRKPQLLPAGSVTVLGKLDNEGSDVFRFDGKAGETWRIEVFARRLNRETKLEPILRLRDPRLAPVRAAVDQGQDCYIEHKLSIDGPYLIELFDADNRSGGDFNYRLALRRL